MNNQEVNVNTETETQKSELVVLDKTGDTKLMWSKGSDDEVEAARETFTRLRKKGYLAYKVKKDGEKGEQIHEFDEDAERIILAPPMRGG